MNYFIFTIFVTLIVFVSPLAYPLKEQGEDCFIEELFKGQVTTIN